MKSALADESKRTSAAAQPPISNPPLKRVLIISPAFAPMSTPDSQRVRMSLPYYRENGWEPIVLAVAPDRVDAPREDSLLETLPNDVEIHHCSALAQKIARRFGLGNLGWRAWWPVLFSGARLIRKKRIDLIFFSTTQFALLPLGRIWFRWLGVPYVVDLQDPWRTDYYERPGVRRPPGGWKYQAARAQAAILEDWTFKTMSGLISVSAAYLQDLAQRYQWFGSIPAATIGFGASEHDLEVAKRRTSSLSRPPPSGALRLVYTGAAGPITPHAIGVFFQGLQVFRQKFPVEAARLRCEFVGTSYAADDDAVATLRPFAERFQVADLVNEIPGRVGHLECLRLQAEADVLLLLGSSDLAYSPSKLYPYYLARRPILSVVFRESILEKILRELNCSTLATFDQNEADQAIDQIVRFLEQLTSSRGVPHPARNDTYFKNHYLARNLTARQAELFHRAVAFRPHASVV